jgi:hypothetical protein
MILKDELEQTLSFFEPMNKEMIYLDLNNDYVKGNNSITIEQVDLALAELKKEKKVKTIKKEGHLYWIRIYPKKSILQKIKRLIVK